MAKTATKKTAGDGGTVMKKTDPDFTIPTYDKITEIKGGTILEQSKIPFQNFHDKPDSGTPVQFCWNQKTDKFNSKTGAVTSETNLNVSNYYCMRSFNGNYAAPTDGLVFKVTNKKGRPAQLAHFYNYLFSKESPWRDAFQNLVFVGKDKYGIPDSIVWFDTAIGDAKLVINLFSTIRLHTCWGLDAVWQKLVETGFTNEEAMLLCSNFSFAGQTITVSNGPTGLFDEDVLKKLSLSKFGCSKTDMPFSTNYNPSGFYPLLVDKKPKSKGKPLASQGKPQPNNYIWHADGIEVNADNLTKSSKEYVKGTLHVTAAGKDPYGFVSYLKGGQDRMSDAIVSEIREKLVKNIYLEI